jgi:hypothetical protein
MVRVSDGMGVRASVEHRNKRGELVSIQRNFDRFPAYHAWRAKWCEQHRTAYSPRGFREGKINPLTISFAALLKIQEVLNGIRR